MVVVRVGVAAVDCDSVVVVVVLVGDVVVVTVVFPWIGSTFVVEGSVVVNNFTCFVGWLSFSLSVVVSAELLLKITGSGDLIFSTVGFFGFTLIPRFVTPIGRSVAVDMVLVRFCVISASVFVTSNEPCITPDGDFLAATLSVIGVLLPELGVNLCNVFSIIPDFLFTRSSNAGGCTELEEEGDAD